MCEHEMQDLDHRQVQSMCRESILAAVMQTAAFADNTCSVHGGAGNSRPAIQDIKC